MILNNPQPDGAPRLSPLSPRPQAAPSPTMPSASVTSTQPALQPYPKEPSSPDELDISKSVIEGIILRAMQANMSMVAGDIAKTLGLNFYNIVEPILSILRDAHLIEVTRGDLQPISYVYGITDAGFERANQYLAQTTYIGPAPVSLHSYVEWIKRQSMKNITVNAEKLFAAFEGLVFDQDVIDDIGPAVNSGKSIFIYGPPGNGKSSVCERIVQSFGDAIFIPYVIEVKGQIIKLYDEHNHVPAPQATGHHDPRLQKDFDQRFILIQRPVIIVGGELTMETLDLIWSEESRMYEAPFQMKANGGAFMIDDFGRQRVEPKVLLNRWIVPLEKRVDFLTLHTGTKIEIPFDQLIVFSTNLDPKELVDDAFLRRIRYKIPVNDPSEEGFRKIWEIVCKIRKVPHEEDLLTYFIETHLKAKNRPFRGCAPRDIIDNILDICRYREIKPVIMTRGLLDEAAGTYFVNFAEEKKWASSM